MNLEKLLQTIKSTGAIGIAIITLYMFYMLANSTIQRNTEAMSEVKEAVRTNTSQSVRLETAMQSLEKSLYINQPMGLK